MPRQHPGGNYARGTVAEHRLTEELEGQGYAVTRGAGSKGWDLIACRHDHLLLISVKRRATVRAANEARTRERRLLRRTPVPPSLAIKVILAIWVDAPAERARGGRWHTFEEVAYHAD